MRVLPTFFSSLWRLLTACTLAAVLTLTLGRVLPAGVQIAFLRASGLEFADGIYALDANHQVTVPLLRTSPASAYPFALSPDGTRLAFSRDDLNSINIYIATLQSGSLHALIDPNYRNLVNPKWSPDGQQLVFTCQKGAHTEICIADTNEGSVRSLTMNTEQGFHSPDWSPDGTRIVIADNVIGGAAHLCVLPFPPTSTEQFSPEHCDPVLTDNSITTTAWSPDGRMIAFHLGSIVNATFGIYLIDAHGGQPYQLTSGYGISPAWSPDGQWLAFSRWEMTHYDVYIMRADGTDQRRLTTDPRNDLFPVWLTWR